MTRSGGTTGEPPAEEAAPAKRLRAAKGTATTSDRILAAAKTEFVKNGYGGARVDKIARRANVNKQMLYYYFSSKELLYKAVIEDAYLRYSGDEKAIRAAVGGPDLHPETALIRLMEHLFERPAFNDLQRLIQDANFNGGKHMGEPDGVRRAFDFLIRSVTEILDRGAAAGLFREGIDPREFYISLVGLFGSRIGAARTMSYALGVDLLTKEGAQRSRDYALELLFRGIRKAP